MFGVSTIGEAADTALRSHHVLYEMKQIHKANGGISPISRVDGSLRYEFKNTCDGWEVGYYTVLNLEYTNGQAIKKSWFYSSQEAADGSRFRFRSDSRDNDVLSAEHSGVVRKVNGKKQVIYSKPEGRRETLPEATLFPTSHLIHSLEAAQKGETVFNASYFDGSGPGLNLDVSTVSTRAGDGKVEETKKFNLPPMAVWNMRLAFFPPESQKSEPQMEIVGRYRLDGVLTHILQDFGVFALKGQMMEFNYLDEPKCK